MCTFHQGGYCATDFMERFISLHEVVNQQSGKFWGHNLIWERFKKNIKPFLQHRGQGSNRKGFEKRLKACMFIKNINNEKHRDFKWRLANNYVNR